MTSKSPSSRSVINWIATALVVACGTAGAPLAAAQSAPTTFTLPAPPSGLPELTAEQNAAGLVLIRELEAATSKAQIVAALNKAANANLTKAMITKAIDGVVKLQTAMGRPNSALTDVQSRLNANLAPDTSVMTFYTGSGSSQSTAAITPPPSGGNAVSGSLVQQSNNNGSVSTTQNTTTNTTSVYVG